MSQKLADLIQSNQTSAALAELENEETQRNINDQFKYDSRYPPATCLTIACEKGNEPLVIKILGIKRVDVNKGNSKSLTPLFTAVAGHQTSETVLLLQVNDILCKGNDNGTTPIHYAAIDGYDDILTLLLDKFPSEINCQNDYQWTPLHYSVYKGHISTTSILLQRGAQCLANVSGDYPIHEGAMKGYDEIVKKLLKYFPDKINVQNNQGRTPLHLSLLWGTTQVSKVLRESGASEVLSASLPSVEQAKVLYPYKATDALQLDLETGDIIDILDKDTGYSDIWLGKVHGRTGFVKINCVEILHEKKTRSPDPSTSAKTDSAPLEQERTQHKGAEGTSHIKLSEKKRTLAGEDSTLKEGVPESTIEILRSETDKLKECSAGEIEKLNNKIETLRNKNEELIATLRIRNQELKENKHIICSADYYDVRDPSTLPYGKGLVAIFGLFTGHLTDTCLLILAQSYKRDIETIKTFFEDTLKYEVVIHENTTEHQFLSALKELQTKLNFSQNYDRFLCFILSHGDKSGILMCENEVGYYDGIEAYKYNRVPLQGITSYFDHKQVSAMKGFPKCFIVQTCRGEHNAKAAGSEPHRLIDSTPIALGADILECYACSEDTKSFVHVAGSIYIQKLIRFLENDFEKKDIYDILTKVQGAISQTPVYEDNEKAYQMPCFQSTFTKKFMLKLPVKK